MKNLRDNADGTCNCRPLGGGCFFTDGFYGPCDCKCHQVLVARTDSHGHQPAMELREIARYDHEKEVWTPTPAPQREELYQEIMNIMASFLRHTIERVRKEERAKLREKIERMKPEYEIGTSERAMRTEAVRKTIDDILRLID